MFEIDIINTKEEIIRKHAKKIVELSDRAEFWEALATKRKEQLHIAMNFIQYILDQWEIDTYEAQEKAVEFVKKINEIKIK